MKNNNNNNNNKIKKNKMTNAILHIHIQISLSSKFQIQQFWFFGKNFPKKDTSGLNRKEMNIIIEFFIFKLV